VNIADHPVAAGSRPNPTKPMLPSRGALATPVIDREIRVSNSLRILRRRRRGAALRPAYSRLLHQKSIV
jgi:hypothetical protein